MKTTKYFAAFASLLIALSGRAQEYYTVNNVPGAQANYTSLQTALDSVPAGSVILVQPSGLDYGNVTLTKPVVIYGAGYFLGENAPPSTQPRFITSKVRLMTFLSKAAGSIVSGIHFTAFKSQTDVAMHFDSTNNISISRCYFENFGGVAQGSVPRHIEFIASSNIEIKQCYFETDGPSQWTNCIMYTAGGNSGILYSNNIIKGGGKINAFGSNNDQVTFTNNTFMGGIGSNLNNNLFFNNIFLFTQSQSFFDQMNPASSNNLATQNIFPNASVNKINTSLTADGIFLAGAVGSSSHDAYFKLKDNTEAAGYGKDGTDCGAFGGSKPYVLSGIPAIPNFYAVDVAADATQVGGLKIQLKVKANN